MFGFLAPLHKATLMSSPLQSHLSQLENLTHFCDNILSVYFNSSQPCKTSFTVFYLFIYILKSSLHVCSLHVYYLGALFISHDSKLTFICGQKLYLSLLSFPGSPSASVQETKDANLQKLTQLVNKESNLIEKVLVLFSCFCMGYV